MKLMSIRMTPRLDTRMPQADVSVMMDVVKNTDQEMLKDAGIDVDIHRNWLQFTLA